MFLRFLFTLWLALLCMSSPVAAADQETPGSNLVPETFFGLHMHKPIALGSQPWPTIPFATGRLWSCGVYWAQINTAKGVYDWSLLDAWLKQYHQHGIDDVMYTFGRVPQWASSRPNDSSCVHDPNGGLGVCDPPEDLKSDGTGPNQHWKDFVSAIATHSKNSNTAHIRYWEIWNEPYMPRQWTGTNAQLVRMEHDAQEVIKSIDATAVIVSPPPAMKSPRQQQWMEQYLGDQGAKLADVIGFHGYIHSGKPGDRPTAADIIPAVKTLRQILQSHGLGSMAIIDTEASWGRAQEMGFVTDEDFEAAFLAQSYLLHWSAGVSRFYWYAWNNQQDGTLWNPDPDNPSAPGRVHKPGIAYRQVHDWMVGATMTHLCSSNDQIWTCGFTRPGGYQALAVWSTGGTRTYNADPKLKLVRDLDGNTKTITDSKVLIGSKPLLLANK